jgi:hypothetical protein
MLKPASVSVSVRVSSPFRGGVISRSTARSADAPFRVRTDTRRRAQTTRGGGLKPAPFRRRCAHRFDFHGGSAAAAVRIPRPHGRRFVSRSKRPPSWRPGSRPADARRIFGPLRLGIRGRLSGIPKRLFSRFTSALAGGHSGGNGRDSGGAWRGLAPRARRGARASLSEPGGSRSERSDVGAQRRARGVGVWAARMFAERRNARRRTGKPERSATRSGSRHELERSGGVRAGDRAQRNDGGVQRSGARAWPRVVGPRARRPDPSGRARGYRGARGRAAPPSATQEREPRPAAYAAARRRPAAFVLAAVEALAGADGRSGVPAGLISGGPRERAALGCRRGSYRSAAFVRDPSRTRRRRRGRWITARSDVQPGACGGGAERSDSASRRRTAEQVTELATARAVPLGGALVRLGTLRWRARASG